MERPMPVSKQVECTRCGKMTDVLLSYYTEDSGETYELEEPSNNHRCQKCFEKYLEVRKRSAELMSPCAPSWFDPSDAGERWDDDY